MPEFVPKETELCEKESPRMNYAVGETIIVKDKGNTACVITVVKEEEGSCEMRKKVGVEGVMDPDAMEGATPLRSLRREPWPEE